MPDSLPRLLGDRPAEIYNPQSSHLADQQFSSSTEEQIWDQFRKGNESAFVHIYKSHFDSLYNYGCQLTPDTTLVEDAIQDLFIYLRQKRKRLSRTTSIRPYLFKSIKRRILRDKTMKQRSLGPEENFTSYQISFSHEQTIVDSQIELDCRQRISSMLKGLPNRQKAAIYYYYYENLEYKDIRNLMGLKSAKSVRNLIYKAFKSIRLSVTR